MQSDGAKPLMLRKEGPGVVRPGDIQQTGDIQILNPVQGNGQYAEDLPLFGGLNIWKACPRIIEVLGQSDRLDHGEALARPVLEIAVGLLAVETMEQLPRRVAEVEERPAVLVDEEPPVLAHLQARRGGFRRRGGGGEGERERQGRGAREGHGGLPGEGAE